jgi:VWFA-related protein
MTARHHRHPRLLLAGFLASGLALVQASGLPASEEPGKPPPAAGKPAPPAPDGPLPTPYIERATSELVLIEVYATDRKGRPVRDLTTGDLKLKIDQKGTPRPILSLEWMEPPPGTAPLPGGPPQVGPGAATGQEAGAAAPAPAAAPGAAPAGPTGRSGWPRRFLLFFDDATSAAIQMTNARRQAIAFLDRPGMPSDQFALVSYSEKRRLEILHEFTSDRAALRKVLERSIEDKTRMSDYATERDERKAEIQRKLKEATMFGGTAGSEAESLARSYASQDSVAMGRVLTTSRSSSSARGCRKTRRTITA